MYPKNLILEKSDYSKNLVEKKIFEYLLYIKLKRKPIIVCDIHNTIEYDNKKIDDDVFSMIKRNYAKYNFFFCSYDGNADRIKFNSSILNNYSNILKKIPKIFIKKRNKGLILDLIYKYFQKNIGFDKRYKYNLIFIDDNENNIKDSKKYSKKIKKLLLFNYTKHSKYSNKHNNLNELLQIVKFL